MYISNLHIQGFKSFLNKTDLRFGEGITSIVGPNGCGKSNIVDAIRWILGEQKTTVLRSQKMEDVIFKGAKNYKPLGFCEVSLTINNNKGRLPTEYTDVEITRRYYRSGESEYLFNKVPCRLKDITGLFMDSGLSANAYSVIELKMIDSIVSHNPEERKKLFEEAAGINYYKKQRQSTFRKLEATRIDLDRVGDIISEVENNVRSLKLQLKRFERHKKLSEKLKSSDILLAQAEIQLIDMEAAPLLERISERRSQQSALSGQVSLDEGLIAETQGKYEAAKLELETFSNSVTASEKKLGEINNNLLVWAEQRKANELRISQYSDESIQTTTRIETIHQQIEALKEDRRVLQPKIAEQKTAFQNKSAEFDAVLSDHRKTENEYNELRKRFEYQVEQVYKAESRFHKTRVEIDEKNALIDRLQNQKEQFIEKISGLQFSLDEFQGQLKSNENINSALSLEIETLQNNQASAEEALINEKEKLTNTQSQLAGLISKCRFYEKIISSHEGKSTGAKYVLNHPDQFTGVIGGISDLIEVEEKYRPAIEIALGEALHYLVVDTEGNAIHNLEGLKKNSKSGISIIPLESVSAVNATRTNPQIPGVAGLSVIKYKESLKNLFAFLLGDIRIVEIADIIRGLSPDLRKQYSWVTVTGDYFGNTTVIKSGGDSKESLIGRQTQLDSLKKEISSREKELVVIKNNIKVYQDNANTIRAELKVKHDKLDQSVKANRRLENELAQLKYSDQNLHDRLQENDQIIEDNRSILKTLGETQTRLNGSLEELKRELKTIKQQITDAGKSLESISKVRNEKQQQKQDARVQLVEIEKESEGLIFRLQSSESQLKDLMHRQQQIGIKSDELTEKVSQLGQSIAEESIRKDELLREQNSLLENKHQVQKTYNEIYERLQDLQRSVVERQKIKEENILQITQVELKLAELTKEKELKKAKIQEVYHTTVPTQVLNLNDIDINELRDSISVIDKSINRIGPINMAVADEYKSESERYEFLKKQCDDLNESEASLKQSIEKIDNEARKKFTTTFQSISDNFKQTYAMFFKGGEAHVRLVGSEDPLEAEIEIIARPPGKRTQTIRMLSAGEKALTAISLLFAIYLVKPSPFCILDEVDAPLDDNNIAKFTEVLRKFSANTQFIVITHNKLTMEQADYLYGVTQEDEGVSTIVSVKFEDDGIPGENVPS